MTRRRPFGPGRFRTVTFAFPFTGPAPVLSDTGMLAIDVYTADGATKLGTIPVVFGGQIAEKVNEVSSFSVQVPAEYKTLVSVGNQIRIIREGEGVIFIGYADTLGIETD